MSTVGNLTYFFLLLIQSFFPLLIQFLFHVSCSLFRALTTSLLEDGQEKQTSLETGFRGIQITSFTWWWLSIRVARWHSTMPFWHYLSLLIISRVVPSTNHKWHYGIMRYQKWHWEPTKWRKIGSNILATLLEANTWTKPVLIAHPFARTFVDGNTVFAIWFYLTVPSRSHCIKVRC